MSFMFNIIYLWQGAYVYSTVSLCVCLLATLLNSYERIALKLYGGVWGGKRNKWLNFGGDQRFAYTLPSTIIVACPDRGAGNDPENFQWYSL